ncbi:MliC family protein [Rhizobiales bacterium]|uniref:MliC family protein n=1 Tax=Hongsoonwoonella zoysiae TaxID=2821844 RepID=UPI0015601A43|nr:MliC family protein [Hongsoonwoonella zoysiae]NRG16695.1 MliC family protein [Hongsoonwoonella zoysiae]
MPTQILALLRPYRLAACGAILLILGAGAAIAETRILSVGTDDADVNVEAVYFANERLREVGRSEDNVFVEIGKPDESFVCRRSLRFRLSNGHELRKTLDLCATNYQVSVATGEALRIEREVVMIEVDDGSEIREVRISGRPAKITRKAPGTAYVEVEGDPANQGRITCRQDLRIVLQDGRILNKEDDLCGDNRVFIAADTAGEARQGERQQRTVRQAVPSRTSPSAPPLSGGSRPQRPGQDRSGETDTARSTPRDTLSGEADANGLRTDTGDGEGLLTRYANKRWIVEDPSGTDRTAALIYGTPETDDIAFYATCTAESGEAEITLAESTDSLREGSPVDVALQAREEARRYRAVGAPLNEETDQSHPTFTIETGDPLWEDLARGYDLKVGIGGEWRYSVSLDGSAAKVRRFHTLCSPPQRIVEADPARPAPGYGQGAPAVPADGPTCANEGVIRAIASDEPASITFRNNRRQPVFLNWIDYRGDRVLEANIPPGGVLRQPTVMGHPWLVSSPRGRCLGIYLPSRSARVVDIRPGRPQAPVAPPPVAAPYEPPYPTRPRVSDADYACDYGTQLNVIFDNSRNVAVVREFGLSPVTLYQRRSGSGFFYKLRGYELRGSGNRATWLRPGAPPVACRVF